VFQQIGVISPSPPRLLRTKYSFASFVEVEGNGTFINVYLSSKVESPNKNILKTGENKHEMAMEENVAIWL
jgi:hypothetical protein